MIKNDKEIQKVSNFNYLNEALNKTWICLELTGIKLTQWSFFL